MTDVMSVAKYVGIATLSIMIVLYVGSVLNTSLNDTNVNTVWGNVIQFFTNFTSKLADAGTVLGVVLIIGLFALAGIWGAKKAGYM